jgi:CSLREA domain-containing protein
MSSLGERVLKIAVMALMFFAVVPAQAKTLTVNSTTDAVAANPAGGVCETAPGNGICTLRAAIQVANALPGPDTIILPAGTYTLTIPGQGEDAAAAGDLDITDDITITGGGAARRSICFLTCWCTTWAPPWPITSSRVRLVRTSFAPRLSGASASGCSSCTMAAPAI